MISADNLPKAWIKPRNGKQLNYVRPDVEIEMPDFIALAEEI